jgi:hypothetical protein
LLLAGCSGDPEPAAAPTTPTPTAEPTPTESPSPEPSATETAPKEIVLGWIKAYNDALEGDVSGLELASKRCPTCQPLVDRLFSIYRRGGSIDGGHVDVLSVRRTADMGDLQAWIVHVQVAPTQYRESAEGVEKSLPGGRSAYRLVLDPNGRRVFEMYVEAT